MAGLVPVMFGLSLLVPEGSGLPFAVGPALGCSGGGNNPAPPAGFTWLKPTMMSNTERTSVPVATDAFFVIDVEGNSLTADEALAAVVVEVRDEAGELVPGQTWLLKEKQPGWYLFGWEAGEAHKVGTILTAYLSAEPWSGDGEHVGGDFRLDVVGEPTSLLEPALTFPTWVDFFHGLGGNVSCPADPDRDSCGGPESVEVPGAFSKLQAAHAVWQLPAISGGVAWEAHLEPTSGETDVWLPEASTEYLGDIAESELGLGQVVFPTPASEHCVTLVVTDFRTGDATSADVCAPTESATRYDTDSQLRLCLEPPTETAGEAWCLLQYDLAPPECEAILEAPQNPGEPGRGGAPSSDPGDDGAARRARTSKGCQLGAGTTGPSSALAAALGLLVATRRRRR